MPFTVWGARTVITVHCLHCGNRHAIDLEGASRDIVYSCPKCGGSLGKMPEILRVYAKAILVQRGTPISNN